MVGGVGLDLSLAKAVVFVRLHGLARVDAGGEDVVQAKLAREHVLQVVQHVSRVGCIAIAVEHVHVSQAKANLTAGVERGPSVEHPRANKADARWRS